MELVSVKSCVCPAGTGDGAVLQQVPLPVVDKTLCGAWYNETITTDNFCAGFILGGSDACKVGGVGWGGVGRWSTHTHTPSIIRSRHLHKVYTCLSASLYQALYSVLKYSQS